MPLQIECVFCGSNVPIFRAKKKGNFQRFPAVEEKKRTDKGISHPAIRAYSVQEQIFTPNMAKTLQILNSLSLSD